ncbi:hypothetical protein GCM10027275_31290 [Rhabdobacter roseus]|uniref:ADP,ATP carrier protein n=1 Tax=Rhabdobacter roseus TaxID=1655419 RepID=A0A840TY15_9BACT|nr:HEAT repeat domain-containing protein [Rhabdobacter roseus]MBB5285088.1 hypothetical protein [Rhabdobacter roseus]
MWKRDTLLKLLNIKQGEEKLVFLLIGYSFVMGGAMAIFYTVVASSFLMSFNSLALPQAYIVGGVFVYSLGLLVTQAQRLTSFARLAEGLLIFLIVSIAGLVAIHHYTSSKWVFFVLFIWNRVFVLVNGVTFWGVVAKLFNLQQAKRLSSLISTGDVISSVVAYLSIPLVIKYISADYLLYTVVGLLIICAVLMHRLHRIFLVDTDVLDLAHEGGTPQTAVTQAKPEPEPPLINKAYYSNIFLLALLPVFGLFYVEYLFFTESRAIFPDKVLLASFLGFFFGISAIIEFFIKTFFYNRLLSKYGLRIGIIMLPASLVFGFILASLYGIAYEAAALFFACIVLGRFFMSAIRKAISEPAFQVLFQPIAARIRLEVQGRIEGRAKAIGGLLAGVLLLVLTQVPFIDAQLLSVLFLLIAVLWLYISIKTQGTYKSTIRDRVYPLQQPRDAQPRRTTRKHPATSQSHSFEALITMVSSPQSADRIEAARGLCCSGRFLAYKYLIPLLQDPDPNVREAALEASGALYRPELWPYLLEQLNSERYALPAAKALAKVGKPLLREIDRFFLNSSEEEDYQEKLIEIVEQIGGEEAIRFLRRKLNFPQRSVREKVIETLQNLGYVSTHTEQTILLQEFEDHVAFLAWLLAAQTDILGTYEPDSELGKALEREHYRTILKVFTVLSVIYGDKFKVITLLLENKNEDVRDYLMEISELLLPEPVKDKVLPMIDGSSLEEMNLRYQAVFPQETLSVKDRLKDIINKDYTRISPWTKAIAIKELQHDTPESVTPILVANAVASSRLISETALYVLRVLNPERYTSLTQNLARQHDDFHGAIVSELAWVSHDEELLVCKLRRLWSVEVLRSLKIKELKSILLRAHYLRLERHEVLDLQKLVEPDEDYTLIVTHGTLVLASEGAVGSGTLWQVPPAGPSGAPQLITAQEASEAYLVQTYKIPLHIPLITQPALVDAHRPG